MASKSRVAISVPRESTENRCGNCRFWLRLGRSKIGECGQNIKRNWLTVEGVHIDLLPYEMQLACDEWEGK